MKLLLVFVTCAVLAVSVQGASVLHRDLISQHVNEVPGVGKAPVKEVVKPVRSDLTETFEKLNDKVQELISNAVDNLMGCLEKIMGKLDISKDDESEEGEKGEGEADGSEGSEDNKEGESSDDQKEASSDVVKKEEPKPVAVAKPVDKIK